MVGHRAWIEGCARERSSSEDLLRKDGVGTRALEANVLVDALEVFVLNDRSNNTM